MLHNDRKGKEPKENQEETVTGNAEVEVVDIFEPPQPREQLPGEVHLIGDLHANAIKFIHFLKSKGIIEVNDEAYRRLVVAYISYMELTEEIQKAIDKNIKKAWDKYRESLQGEDLPITFLNFSSRAYPQEYQKIKEDQVIRAKIERKKKVFWDFVLLLDECYVTNPHENAAEPFGDDAGDRGADDYFIFLIYKKLKENNVNVDDLISNHGAELLSAYVNNQLFIGTLLNNQSLSMQELGWAIQEGLVSREEVNELIKDYYLPSLKIVDYVLSPDGSSITILSHAAIDLEIIQIMAEKINVYYDDSSAVALALTINRINQTIKNKIENEVWTFDINNQNETLVSSSFRGADEYGYTKKDHARLNPFYYTLWNRNYAELKRNLQGDEAQKKGFALRFAHGHDSNDKGMDNKYVDNLDNDVGKFLLKEHRQVFWAKSDTDANFKLRQGFDNIVIQEKEGQLIARWWNGITSYNEKEPAASSLPLDDALDNDTKSIKDRLLQAANKTSTDPDFINEIERLFKISLLEKKHNNKGIQKTLTLKETPLKPLIRDISVRYSYVSVLDKNAQRPITPAPCALAVQKKFGRLTVYWNENGKVVNKSFRKEEVKDIIRKLPQASKVLSSPSEITLIKAIIEKYGCPRGDKGRIKSFIEESIAGNKESLFRNLFVAMTENPSRDIIKLFVEKIEDINLQHEFINQDTSLHMAVRSGRRDIVELMLQHGAAESIYIKNKGGETPLDIAINMKDDKLAYLLATKVDKKNENIQQNEEMQKILNKDEEKKFILMHEIDAEIERMQKLSIDSFNPFMLSNNLKIQALGKLEAMLLCDDYSSYSVKEILERWEYLAEDVVDLQRNIFAKHRDKHSTTTRRFLEGLKRHLNNERPPEVGSSPSKGT